MMKFRKMKWTNEHIVQLIYLRLDTNSSVCLHRRLFLAWESVSSCFVWNLFLAFVLTLGGLLRPGVTICCWGSC